MASTPHTHVHPPGEKRALQLRLRKIAGQIGAIEKMIDEDRDCPDVLMQVVSVRKALKSFAQVVLHQHSHECIEHASDPKTGQRKLRELLSVLERYVE
jgi:DNA-binding FrmR family transcriptional regulator